MPPSNPIPGLIHSLLDFSLAFMVASVLLFMITVVLLLRQRQTNLQLAELHALSQQTSRKLQATLDALPDLLFEIGLDGRIHDYHSPRTDLLALPPAQFLGRTLQEVLPPEVADTCQAALEEANRSGTSGGKRYALALSRGTAWFELSVARKPELPGRMPRFIVLARDITERTQTEHELRLLQRAINGSSDAMFIKDVRTNRFVSVNDAACRSLGYTRDELLGMTPLDIDPDITEEAIAQAHEMIESGVPHMLETRHRSKDGRIFPVEITGAFFEDNGIRYALALVRNITARKQLGNTLHFIADTSGEQNFLTALARHLGETLGAAYVVIDKLADEPSVAETVALYANGDIVPNMRYALADTPCDHVVGKRTCCYPNGVQTLFPKDALLVDMAVDSYAGVPLWDSTGQPIGLIAIMDTVPMADEAAVVQLLQIVAPRAAAELERARSDARLRASEHAFRALIENSPDNVVRYDRECRRGYLNPAALRTFGRHSDLALGKTPLEFSPVSEPSQYIGYLRQVLDAGEEIAVEMSYHTAEGSMRWGHVRLVPESGPDGAVASVLAVTRDITEIKESELRFRTLTENSPNIIVRYDRECQRIYVNRAYEEQTEKKRENVTPADPARVWRSDISMPVEEYKARLQEVMATGKQTLFDLSWTKQLTGEVVHHALHVVPEYDFRGNIVGTLAIGHNITALKAAEQRLRESYERLQELSVRRESAREEERKRIAREIHDELGQQLSALRLKVNVLDRRFGAEVPALREATAGLLTLVDNTIRIARNVSASLRPAVLDMGIAPALEWLAGEFRQNTGIRCDLGPMPASLPVDEERSVALFRITQESLTNVLRHAEATQVRITLEQRDGCHALEIFDNGKGFDPSAPRHRHFGLVGMRERAQAIGGIATVDSFPGRGTRIQVTIPPQATGENSLK